MIPWDQIKTEYVTGQMTYRQLCKKYRVSYSTLNVHARCDHWVEAREKHRMRTLEKSLDKIGDQQAESLAQVNDLADQLLQKLEKAIGELDLQVIQWKEKGESQDGKWEKTYEQTQPGGTVDRQGLKALSASLKELKAIKNIQTALEKLEQEAKIEALQNQADTAQSLTVVLDKGMEGYSE